MYINLNFTLQPSPLNYLFFDVYVYIQSTEVEIYIDNI